jgi:hypothetical protein
VSASAATGECCSRPRGELSLCVSSPTCPPPNAGMVEPFRGFGLRWGSDAFCQYVVQLESMADDALAAASKAERCARPPPRLMQPFTGRPVQWPRLCCKWQGSRRAA